ncbi:GNAT family N-acetyltransferase [Natribacillus halophilus]|uniref:Protein N-acetyltransferase, RimJ/RimL family n=1 Tax=Natribacillus halophilus TaxID=549003 RepID=A0A1G8LMH2_9BACI|nr:GNAT family protein [Natribacillus halophilus]SDI56876.1 Protein N-acetyltransferase, RimJ/RimL family [Natribacillus halophilus]
MIRLEHFGREDFDLLISWIDSPEFLMQWAGTQFSYPLDEEQLNQYIKGANEENSTVYIYKAVLNETNETIGHISLKNIDLKNRSASISKVLLGNTQIRGKGIGQKMVTELLKVAFDSLSLHRVGLGVFAFNEPAIKTYEKAGFVKEGLLRDFRKMEDGYWSLWQMSILENEWIQI